ncbi:hypothetical protein [Nitrosomonas sp.]|nr:hypothetical protein [Nitrosomonas sp.]
MESDKPSLLAPRRIAIAPITHVEEHDKITLLLNTGNPIREAR